MPRGCRVNSGRSSRGRRAPRRGRRPPRRSAVLGWQRRRRACGGSWRPGQHRCLPLLCGEWCVGSDGRGNMWGVAGTDQHIGEPPAGPARVAAAPGQHHDAPAGQGSGRQGGCSGQRRQVGSPPLHCSRGMESAPAQLLHRPPTGNLQATLPQAAAEHPSDDTPRPHHAAPGPVCRGGAAQARWGGSAGLAATQGQC